MNIGIIGSGALGSNVARALANKGLSATSGAKDSGPRRVEMVADRPLLANARATLEPRPPEPMMPMFMMFSLVNK